MIKRYPVIRIELPEPVSGYWDGGKKSVFEFKPDPRVFEKGDIVWGSYDANFFFTARSGVSWNTAVAAAKKKINTMLKIKNAKITVVLRDE